MWTLSAPHRLEQVIQKSRFLAFAARADDREAALGFVEAHRDPTATHHCFAFQVGSDYRFNDDGEPGGTAGQPILRAIQGQGLDRVVVLVVRWFGGIKLGAGGLVRAYGGTAAECLRTAPRVELRPMVSLVLELPFDAVASAYRILEAQGAIRLEETYVPSGLCLTVSLEVTRRPTLEALLRDATRGRAICREP